MVPKVVAGGDKGLLLSRTQECALSTVTLVLASLGTQSSSFPFFFFRPEDLGAASHTGCLGHTHQVLQGQPGHVAWFILSLKPSCWTMMGAVQSWRSRSGCLQGAGIRGYLPTGHKGAGIESRAAIG